MMDVAAQLTCRQQAPPTPPHYMLQVNPANQVGAGVKQECGRDVGIM